MDNAAWSWAEEVFGQAELGDSRRTRRLVHIAAEAAARPGGRVLEVCRTTALAKVLARLALFTVYSRIAVHAHSPGAHASQRIPNTHSHVYDWSTRGGAGQEILSHAPGEYVP